MVVDMFVRRRALRFIAKVLMVIIAFIVFFPILHLLLNSIKYKVEILAIPPKWIFTPTTANYIEAVGTLDFVKGFTNSIIIACISVALAFVVGVPAAYGFSRFSFRGKKGLIFWVLSARFMPPVCVIVPYFMIYKALRLLDTHAGMVIIYLVGNLPFIIWLMYSFFKDVPVELEEAALVDGASPPYVFFNIALPLVTSGMVATAILALIGCWNEFLFAVILTGSTAKTMPIIIAMYSSYFEILWGAMAAASTIAVVPVMIFTLFIQKYLVAGLTLGAVKN